jgi:succinate dehydrogenase hydrophobic anchor subunit
VSGCSTPAAVVVQISKILAALLMLLLLLLLLLHMTCQQSRSTWSELSS